LSSFIPDQTAANDSLAVFSFEQITIH